MPVLQGRPIPNLIRILLTLLVASQISACATLIKGDKQELSISTEPAGAECELKRNGEILGLVKPTPGSISVTKNAGTIEVTCNKVGHVAGSDVLVPQFNAVTFGNVIVGGLIGVVVDAASGANFDYPANVFLKLAPNAFDSAEQRDAYFDSWRAELLRDASQAKAAIARQCSGPNCAQVEQQTDAQVKSKMSQIEATRTRAAVAHQGGEATGTAAGSATGAGDSVVMRGDRWRYRMSDRGRVLGFVVVEARNASATQVTERITHESHASFREERTVSVSGQPDAFQPLVVFPGGYQMPELAPYFPADAKLSVGQVWRGVGGEYMFPAGGRKQLPTEVKLAAKERVLVPAGEFEALRFDTMSDAHSPLGSPYKVKCIFWYATSVRRTVKMEVEILTDYVVKHSKETYELVSFQSGKPQ